MQRLPDLGTESPDLLPLNPRDCVEQADLALLHGSREAAVALIAQAYLAFDLALLTIAADYGQDSAGKK